MRPTAAHVRRIFHYSKKTGIMTWRIAPRTHPRLLGMRAGAKRKVGDGKQYFYIKIDGLAYPLSRVAFLWVTGSWPKDQIDHKNGDSLDDRWKNLRPATQMQNSWNHKGRSKTTNLPMGIRKTHSGKFQARIAKNKVKYNIGSFHSLYLARRAYGKARKELFGEFA